MCRMCVTNNSCTNCICVKCWWYIFTCNLWWRLSSIGNPIVEIRRSYDRLISIMGFLILVSPQWNFQYSWTSLYQIKVQYIFLWEFADWLLSLPSMVGNLPGWCGLTAWRDSTAEGVGDKNYCKCWNGNMEWLVSLPISLGFQRWYFVSGLAEYSIVTMGILFGCTDYVQDVCNKWFLHHLYMYKMLVHLYTLYDKIC